VLLLIPAFEPGPSLADLVDEVRLRSPLTRVLVVDDGSGPGYTAAFADAEAAGATVLGYAGNRGKGHALRTGFRYALENHPGEAVVTADSDGQHRVTDILRVADRLEAGTGTTIVLGGRRFAGEVPLRSRLGNSVSRSVFALAARRRVHDTQTGLRGFPAPLLGWLLTIGGDRFEYELSMLLESGDAGITLDEIPIETVYLEHNASSHFRPVRDSLRVLRPVLVYLAASLGSFVIDVVAVQLLYALSGSLLVAVVGARVTSGSVNFLLNRRLVFRAGSGGGLRRDALRYLALAAVLLGASYGMLAAATAAGVPLLPAKVLTDAALYVVGYLAQRHLVFGRRHPVNRTTSTGSAAAAPSIPNDLAITSAASPVPGVRP
jgi:putative flippase GtrA